jgi:pimeloyl-ACP methyl ester carboxylesterase
LGEDFAGPASRSFISQRLKLHYLDWGNEAAPLLLLLHGGRDQSHSWDWTARALRDSWHVVAPDLRGHGDSAWSPDGDYSLTSLVYDLAQLVHQLGATDVTIVAHSLGGMVALRYAGLYPELVRRMVVIESVGLHIQNRALAPLAERMRTSIADRRALSAKRPRRYASLDEAFLRMRSANAALSEEQARHLTLHGTIRNEDDTYSWKFDNYIRVRPPVDISTDEQDALWASITCPILFFHGSAGWAANPEQDGTLGHFQDGRVVSVEGAGHWLHHDRFDRFMTELLAFLDLPEGEN